MTTEKRQRAVNWIAVIGALGAAGGTIVESYRKGSTDDTIKMTVAREVAMLNEWRRNATADLTMLDEENARLRESVAALTATVELLTERNRPEARRAVSEVKRGLEAPTPDPEFLDDGDGVPDSASVEPTALDKPRPAPKSSRIRASRSIELEQKQVQQQVEQLF